MTTAITRHSILFSVVFAIAFTAGGCLFEATEPPIEATEPPIEATEPPEAPCGDHPELYGSPAHDVGGNTSWANAPWPSGTCLVITQGASGVSHSPPRCAVDLDDGCYPPGNTGFICAFESCRVHTPCRTHPDWGTNLCLEDVHTGEWQFIAHAAWLAPGVGDGAIVSRGSHVAAMGNTGSVIGTEGCAGAGTHLHFEQGHAGTVVGGMSSCPPWPMTVGAWVCSAAPAAGSCAQVCGNGKCASSTLPTTGGAFMVPGSPKVYRRIGDYKHHYADEECFYGFHGSMDEIACVEVNTQAGLLTAPELCSPGSFVKTAGSSTVWAFTADGLAPLCGPWSEAAFESRYGYGFEIVVTISGALLESLPKAWGAWPPGSSAPTCQDLGCGYHIDPEAICWGALDCGSCSCAGSSTQACQRCGTRSRTCNNGSWTSFSECTGMGSCEPGETAACGSGGTKTCDSSCGWGPCQGQSCAGAANEACQRCGTRSRTCNNGSWTSFSECMGMGSCEPGETAACGSGGTKTCDSSCGWGPCEGQSCAGAANEACQRCGTRSRTCNNGSWTSFSECMGMGSCEAGETAACGSGGTKTCTSACGWGPCEGQSCVGPASEACQRCGTRSRTCNNGAWTSFSECTGMGSCEPGETAACGSGGTKTCDSSCGWGPCEGQSCVGAANEACQRCGTRSRTCNNGAWTSFSECTGMGSCEPGETAACGSGGTKTCTSACGWGPCQGQSCDGAASQACQRCGTRIRTCENGTWSPYGSCMGMGACEPGETTPCPGGGTKTCDSGCGWGQCVVATSCSPFVVRLPAGTTATELTWRGGDGAPLTTTPVASTGGTFSSPLGACTATFAWPTGSTTGAPTGTATLAGGQTIDLCRLAVGWGASADGACQSAPSVRFSPNRTTVQIERAAFALIDGTPVSNVGEVCAVMWALGTPWHNQEVPVQDTDQDGWLELHLPPLAAGATPYSGGGCGNAPPTLPARFSLKRCGYENWLVGNWLSYGGPWDTRVQAFGWRGIDDTCTMTGSLAVSWTAELGYWASGASASLPF